MAAIVPVALPVATGAARPGPRSGPGGLPPTLDRVAGHPAARAASPGPALVSESGEVIDLAVDRWRGHADDVEVRLLATLPDPVLDVGCGPGRIVAALAATGRVALGVDTSPRAVDEARRRHLPVLLRSVFGPVPGEGRWATVLLLDGNIGIGGDPEALLARCAGLLRPGGQVLVELEPPGVASRAMNVRLRAPAGHGPWFRWARCGVDDFPQLAAGAGLRPVDTTAGRGRWFGRVVKP